MTIRETTAKVYITEDGEQHTSLEAAQEHEFAKAIERWANANCYTGMSKEDVTSAIIEDRLRLAAIFKEYVL